MISVRKFLSQDAYTNYFIPLSAIVAADQLDELVNLIQGLVVDELSTDQWSYIWGSGEFTSNKAYLHLRGSDPINHVFKWMWKPCCRGRNKFTF